MNIPAFNAEASLYTMSTHYLLGSGTTSGADIRVGLSVTKIPINGGGGTPVLCKNVCSKCRPDPSSLTGCSKTCANECYGVSTVPCPRADCKKHN